MNEPENISSFFDESYEETGSDDTQVYLDADAGSEHSGQTPGPNPPDHIVGNRPSEVSPDVEDRVVLSLLQKEIVDRRGITEAKHEWQRGGREETLWRVVARQSSVDRDAIFAEAARIYAFREAEIAADRPDPAFVKRVLNSFTEEQHERLYDLCLLPLDQEIDPNRGVLKMVLATHDPTRPATLRFVHDLNLDNFELCYAPEEKLSSLLQELFPRKNEYLQRVNEDDRTSAYDLGASYESGDSELVDEDALEDQINRSGLINLFEAALVEAVHQGASDVHIYPNDSRKTEIHFRVDGALRLWRTYDKVHPEALLAVVKDRCMNVDRFEREAAQDGYIQRTVDGARIRYRVSVLPVASANEDVRAESIVIRVIDDRKLFTDLSEIGLLSGALDRFYKAIRQPHGMVIMTGPTGSGKSTTLVAALHHVVTPEVNVLTVEDPVEYLISGVRQIKLGPRLDLENALRSILRHDPDIVMVGEMRDRPTAELAIKLANTGHLTFSTLHTNDAPSAISRLYKMGIEPFLLAYAVNLVVAQRLVRKLCPECKVRDGDPDEVLLREMGFSRDEIQATTFLVAGSNESCRACGGSGYQGRRAIAEAMYLSRKIRHHIVEAEGSIDEDAIREQAVEDGMLTLLASARQVIMQGQTSIDEVIRVTSTG